MKDDRVYLGHIRDAIQDIQQYTSNGRDAFMVDRMRQDASSASWRSSARPSRNSPTTRGSVGLRFRGSRLPECAIDWSHDYFGVDLTLVWVVVERELLALKSATEALLADNTRERPEDDEDRS